MNPFILLFQNGTKEGRCQDVKLGAILQACRERRGMSQEKLAEILHMSRSCISKIENDRKTIEAQMMVRWMDVTNAKEVMVAYLCGVDGIAIMQTVMQMIGG